MSTISEVIELQKEQISVLKSMKDKLQYRITLLEPLLEHYSGKKDVHLWGTQDLLALLFNEKSVEVIITRTT